MPRPGAGRALLSGLDEAARDLIESADTFFVASRSRAELGADGGLDMSHRGGRPGFVGVQGDTLAIPDFRGNRFFNTLGNLLGDPRAGLLFVDFTTGELLQLQGTVDDRLASRRRGPAGTERLWRVQDRARLARRGPPSPLPGPSATMRRRRCDGRLVGTLTRPSAAGGRTRATMASSAST